VACKSVGAKQGKRSMIGQMKEKKRVKREMILGWWSLWVMRMDE